MTLNLATLYESVAAAVPHRPAVVCGDDRRSYAELDARANALAHHLRASGVAPHQHVGLHMLNGVEFVEALLACLKIRAVPVNVNYRYTGHELRYLYADADLVALIVDREFTPAAAATAAHCPLLRHAVIVAGDVAAPDVPWPEHVTAIGYETAVADQPAGAPMADERSPDDHYVLYTGGTTGMPKGVVWRHEDFFFAAISGGNPYGDPYQTAADLAAAAAATATPFRFLITAPLMHGAAAYTLFTGLFGGGKMVLLRRYDPVEALAAIERERVDIVSVVGDAIVRPLADAVRHHGAEYDLSTWKILGSGGAILSRGVRREVSELLPDLFITDRLGASESGMDGGLEVGADGLMRLSPGPRVTVIDDDFKPVRPGSPQPGLIARTGHVPLGYYNDPEKTARTFPVIDGVRWAVLGDLARVDADGSTILLGRGSGCINTGGEKVFPEEVEQALKAHPAVMDAVVAGIADERFGQRVAAVVELREPAPAAAESRTEELRAHCREQLAGYKVPAVIVYVDTVTRSPSGKADYRWAARTLTDAIP